MIYSVSTSTSNSVTTSEKTCTPQGSGKDSKDGEFKLEKRRNSEREICDEINKELDIEKANRKINFNIDKKNIRTLLKTPTVEQETVNESNEKYGNENENESKILKIQKTENQNFIESESGIEVQDPWKHFRHFFEWLDPVCGEVPNVSTVY